MSRGKRSSLYCEGTSCKQLLEMLRTPQTRFKDGSWINRITLGDKVVFEDSRYLGTIGVEASYPADKSAQLVLLSINTDARSCPMALRVLEIRGKDEYVL